MAICSIFKVRNHYAVKYIWILIVKMICWYICKTNTSVLNIDTIMDKGILKYPNHQNLCNVGGRSIGGIRRL